MSDTEATGKALAWTEEAKYQFLLRIIAQYKDAGKAINWSRVSMPGRTTKSLQNMWTKINKAVVELEAQQNGGESAPSTPAKKATPRKRAKKNVDEDDEDPEETPKKSTPRKRASNGASSKSKKIKKLEDDESSIDLKDEVEISE